MACENMSVVLDLGTSSSDVISRSGSIKIGVQVSVRPTVDSKPCGESGVQEERMEGTFRVFEDDMVDHILC